MDKITAKHLAKRGKMPTKPLKNSSDFAKRTPNSSTKRKLPMLVKARPTSVNAIG